MFKLFQSIFRPGGDHVGSYPEDLIERAIERAINATDRRLLALGDHRKRLRPAVIKAIDHVVALVDDLPPPVELSRRSFGTARELGIYFASVEHMNEVLARDPELRQWQKAPASPAAERVYALMIMQKQERNVLGVALEGGQLRRDVAQVTVAFSKQRLVDPTAVEEDTRRLLKRRAFDHLLTLALQGIAELRGERGELERERDLLRGKLKALADGRWGFDEDAGGDEAPDVAALQKRVDDIDGELDSMTTGKLPRHLDILVDVLGGAAQNLRGERLRISVDRQGVKQPEGSEGAATIELNTLQSASGQSAVMHMVSVARADLPALPNFLRDAGRYL